MSRSTRESRLMDVLRPPCLRAFIFEFAMPGTDVGPVAFAQGLQRRISAACRARRSGVQPLFATVDLKHFVRKPAA
jgi:hypothetical protein